MNEQSTPPGLEQTPRFEMIANFRLVDSRSRFPSLRNIYRSGSLSLATPRDIENITRILDVRVIVDLRDTRERCSNPMPGMLERICVSVPVSANGDPLRADDPTIEDYVTYYREILRSRGAQIAKAINVAVANSPYPSIICCHAGKDRTGLVAAALLDQAGANMEEIAYEYALSGKAIADRILIYKKHWEKRGMTMQGYVRRMATYPETIFQLLRGAAQGELARTILEQHEGLQPSGATAIREEPERD